MKTEGKRKTFSTTVNGIRREVEIDGPMTLLELLRDRLGLTGTKNGCAQGKCGACTVVMNGEAVLSCVTPAQKADGAELITIEGLADGYKLHPIQEAFIEAGAVQCGFCTPGIIMRTYALLSKNINASETEMREALRKHLCRCTGYEAILEAMKLAQNKLLRR